MQLSQTAKDALRGCIATRGPNKGKLLATAPSPFKAPLAYAAWQAAQMNCNPYKASILAMLILRDEESRAVYREVNALFEAYPSLRFLDRDREALEKLGVW